MLLRVTNQILYIGFEINSDNPNHSFEVITGLPWSCGEINTGTWPSKLKEPKKRDREICPTGHRAEKDCAGEAQ
jgi:hypothetical protein